ncbi:hypothetical protein psal_cds_211 [Pandoravirus salinus]|uniref:Uncharacterized protein n=1 Tax=Pandoravirus salinus TaxID=1349410 RepID=S4W0U1_9VIRU|nr:hypothetical protein psal_cds_211 [Pandoravirus salinus]AGO83735.1 hypothetical protein psal_cds_211 [Pandoravirus salinus]
MNDRPTRATAARGEGRARIADMRQRRASCAQTAACPSQASPYGAAAPPQQQQQYYQQQQQQQGQSYYGDAQAGPVYSIRSPAMPSTARRMSRVYGDAPGDPRYYGDARAASGSNGVVAGVSSNVRSTAAGATIRRDHTVYAAPPRDCGPGGVVSHMPPSANHGLPAAATTYDPGDGYYAAAPPAAQQQQTYGAGRAAYGAEPPPPPPPMQNGPNSTPGGWHTPNGGGNNNHGNGSSNGNGNAYGAAQVQPQPTYGGPHAQSLQAPQQQQPSYGQTTPLAQQGQPYAQSFASSSAQQQQSPYGQTAAPPGQQPQQQPQQQAYGQAPPPNGQQQTTSAYAQSQPSYGQAPPCGQQQQQQGNGHLGATAYAGAPGNNNYPPAQQANGQFGAAAYAAQPQQPVYGAQQQQQQAVCPTQQPTAAAAYGVQQQQPQAYAQAQQATSVAYGAVAEPQQVVGATQTVGAVAQQSFGAVAPQAVGAVAPQAVAVAAPAAQAVAVSQTVEVAGPPLSLGATAVAPQQTVFAAAPPPQQTVFAAAPPPPQFFAAAPPPLLAAAAPVCQGRRTVSLIRHTDRGSGNALDNAALGLGPPPGSSLFEGAKGPGPAFGDFYALSRPTGNVTLSAGQAVPLTAGSTNNIGLHTGNTTEIVLETYSGNPGTFKIFLSASTTNPSQFGIRVAGQSTTPHVRTFGSDTNFVAGMLILKCITVPAIIELVLVSTDGPNGTTTLPSSPGGTGEARVISLVIEQICCG